MEDPIVIVGIARTPLGSFGGQLSTLAAPALGAVAIAAAIRDAGIDASLIDEVLMGCVLPAGIGQAPARQAAIAAGIPLSVPSTTINKVCGSGMKTVMMACQSLALGQADFVLAGGMESMSLAPHLLAKSRTGYRLGNGELIDHMFFDGLQDAGSAQLMGCFAEATADKYRFSREQQDDFAMRSLRRAQEAIAGDKFQREITAVSVPKTGEEIDKDEQPLKLQIDKIPSLKPAFRAGGSVTAANSSSIADGAAALVLTRRSIAKKSSLKVLAEIQGYSQHAQEPEWFTTAPVGAMTKLLGQQQLSASDIDLYEINEAFAVVTMAAIQGLNLDAEKVNVHGGACALGHPLGASGARILVSLLSAMEQREAKRGIASLCIGGGEGIAMMLSRANL